MEGIHDIVLCFSGCHRKRHAMLIKKFCHVCFPFVYALSLWMSPAKLALLLELPDVTKPGSGLNKSWTATFGTCGTGNLRCAPSERDMMSLMVKPWRAAPLFGDAVAEWYCPSSLLGSIGASAGVCCNDKFLMPGKSYPLPYCAVYGLSRGECAGVASGV